MVVVGYKLSFYGLNNYVNSLNLDIFFCLYVLNFLDCFFVCNNRISLGKRWMKYCIFLWLVLKIFIYFIFLIIVLCNIWVWWMILFVIVNYMVIL